MIVKKFNNRKKIKIQITIKKKSNLIIKNNQNLKSIILIKIQILKNKIFN